MSVAGYVFAIGGDKDPVSSIRACAEKGVFATNLKGEAPIPFEGTLADYVSMKPGDNIYFFCKRRYYGVGELVSVGPDCKYCNYPRASELVRRWMAARRKKCWTTAATLPLWPGKP